ncbi:MULTISPECIES: hypothetical protein [unclassified Methylobacterium]|jgi:hypothetical protein|uniref:hypothetical protein n=1 Tax=unclassified Methylobacterium TaxID=2615210 RepID=UPI001352DD65|nr:hypothetical protein [Methylobacterium sp. 2A]MWV22443.1 hypothetical protein [Methylobacterium sp. 2A]
MPFHVSISRDLAAGMTLVEGPLTPLDLAMWLGALGHAFTIEDEPDAEGLTLRDRWAIDGANLWVHGKALLDATGMRSHSQLVRPFERLGESRIRIGQAGRGNDATYRLWEGWEGTPIHRGHPVEVGYFPGIPVVYGMIHGKAHPIVLDVEGLAAFRTRFAAFLYLRVLAWMNGANTPRAWHRTPPGDRVTVTVPVEDLPYAFGIGTLTTVKQWNLNALGARGEGGPVHADLASVGIGLKTQWQWLGTGNRKTAIGLRITAWRSKPIEKRVERRGGRRTRQLSGSSSPAP